MPGLLILAGLVFVPLVIGLGALLNGWVLSILWRWYLVPVLGLPVLSIPQAIGIALVVGYLTKQHTPSRKEDNAWESIVFVFLHPLMALLFGWLLLGFMS